MKKNILGLAILTALSTPSFGDYVIVLDTTTNDYSIGGFTDVSTGSGWVEKSNDCTVDITEEDVYYGQETTQTKTCTLIEEQTVTVERTYDNGTTEIVDTYQEEKINDSVVTYPTITGTHLEDSCKSILDNGYSNGNGLYKLSYSDSFVNEPTVLCDMTTDGGGWTMVFKKNRLVANNSYELWIGANADQKNMNYNNTSVFSDNSYQTIDYTSSLRFSLSSFSEILMNVNKDNNTVKYIKFNSNGNYQGFMEQSYVLASSWTDLKTSVSNYFNLLGHYEIDRHFYMNQSYGGCEADYGWFVSLSNRTVGCGWETNPYDIYYSTISTAGHFGYTTTTADNFMIYYR